MKRSLTELGPKRKPSGQDFSDSILSKVASGKWEQDVDIEDPEGHAKKASGWSTAFLAFQTLGVVYGDIGTSPLYVISSTFNEAPSEDDILGVISLIIWSITALLAIKYCLIVLRADDNGQGGTFALFSLLKRQAELGKKGQIMESDRNLSQYSIARGDRSLFGRLSQRNSSGKRVPRSNTAPPGGLPVVHEAATKVSDWRQRFIESRHTQNVIRVLVVLGVGMIMGDGVLTPAISVVSACEGLQQASSSITRTWIVIISIIILACLFLIQQFGTKFVGSLFSPIILVWFIFNIVVGIINIAWYRPDIFKVFGPNYWFAYFLRNGHAGWQSLGGVVLCVTGTEALFADLGHFNRPSIQLSTYSIVYPALMITYLGQGSYLLHDPTSYDAMFWKALPNGTFWPMFVVATLAAIIASQALISAVFQIVSQAIHQGFFPRFHIYHTSREHYGQVYIPLINYLLMTLCLIIVGTFQSSANIGKAYGLAVLADMFLTTHFMTLVLICIWRVPLPIVALWYFVFAPIEGTYLSATLEKIPTGGWFSIMMSAIYAGMMLLWFWGSTRKKAFYGRKNLKLNQFLALMGNDGHDHQTSMTIAQQKIALKASSTKLKRVRGVGIYYGEDIHGVPPVLLQFVSRTPVLYEVNIFMTNRFVAVPEVLPSERLLVEQLGVSGFYHVIARYGYMEVVRQDDAFVRVVLERVLHLLYITLQDRASKMPLLHRELGLSDAHKVPPPADGNIGLKEDGVHTPIQDIEGSKGEVQLTSVSINGAPAAADKVKVPGSNDTPTNNDAQSGSEEGPGLDRRRSLRPEDRPPEPFLFRNLEELANKLAAAPEDVARRYHRASIVADEIRIVKHAANQHNVVFVMGHTHVVLPKSIHFWQIPRRALLELPYKAMADFFQETADSVFGVPPAHLLEIGLPYTLHQSH